MLLNFLLLIGVYNLRRFPRWRYQGVIAVGIIKAVAVIVLSRNWGLAAVCGASVAAVSWLILLLFRRLQIKQTYVPRYSVPKAPRPKRQIQWEYAPLAVLFFGFVFLV